MLMSSSSSSSTSSSGISAPASVNVISLTPASPSAVDCYDDNATRFSMHLQRLAGYSEEEADVAKDHSYARPWNWKPENIYVKPMKKIFFSKSKEHRCKKNNPEGHVEVQEEHSEDWSMVYDLTRSRHQMGEFQRLANFTRPEDSEDDWEEKIEKILWLPIHHRIFSKVMRILTSERLARLAKSNCATEPILRRTSIDTAARRFRETLATTGWNWKMIQWLHSLLFDHLPREYLAIYLDILQTLRLKIPQLIDRMISIQPNISGKAGSITWETLGSLLKRSWDPLITCLNSNRPKKLPGNPILIIAPSGISANVSSRQHKWISQLGSLGMVVNVHMHLGLAANRMTMMTCMDQLVQATRAKIQDVRGDCPGRPIIIIGFNSGAALACQVALMEHLTAVVCLGFPFTTVEGKRGTPDDSLMDMRCPVMFVIGQHANLVRPDDIEDVREKMLVETSLLVVGTADDHLRISTTKKISEGITQAMVDRCILDEIGDFVASILLQPHPLPLRPMSLPSYNNVRTLKKEPRKRKNSTSSSVDSESNSPNVKKTRSDTLAIPSSVLSTLPNLVPTTIGARSAPLVPSFSPMSSITGSSPTTTTTMAMTTAMTTMTTTMTTTTTTPTTIITATNLASQFPQMPMQKKRTKVANRQKTNFSDNHMITARNSSQPSGNSDNGGITLNIGSLASLAPIGPIRLAPSGTVGHTHESTIATTLSTATSSTGTTTITAVKRNVNARSPMTLMKIPKIVQTKVAQPSMTKNRMAMQTMSKGFSKIISTNYDNMNMSTVCDGFQAKSTINMPTALCNQGRVGVLTNSVSQNKITANAGNTSGTLTNVLQTGKSTLGVVSPSSVGAQTGISMGSSSSVHLTSSMSSTVITTTSTSKVMDNVGIGGDGNDHIQINSTMSSSKKQLDCATAASSSSPMLLPITNKTPITILPLSGHRAKPGQKNSTKILPKITMNSNSLHKAQCGNIQTLSIGRKNNVGNDIDEDLGNILDIPIIFAKDGDNLGMIEKAPAPPMQIHIPNSVDSVEKSVKRPTTKVVLISNKQDKGKMTNQPGETFVKPSSHRQGATQVILHSRSQNPPPISIGNGLPLHNFPRTNTPTIKYTKIILAKKNTGATNNSAVNNTDKSDQVILTKTTVPKSFKQTFNQEKNEHRYAAQFPIKMSTSSVHAGNDILEIEDAIKTNIIERKCLTIPEIDLTSPSKNQADNDSLILTNINRNPGTEGTADSLIVDKGHI